MGGDIGPASIRGSGVRPGGQHEEAEPRGGYSEPMGYMAGRDDDWAVTAGSDEKAVAARTDGVEEDKDTFGPSPQATPEHAGGEPVRDGDPSFRVPGPVDEEHHGEVDEDGPERPGETAGSGDRAAGSGHVSAGLDWVPSDEDDPDAGSGRTWE
jgi:hypothetical protein